MDSIQAIILAVIEGVTEFLPVSSTGHMALASAFMGIHKEPFTKLFEIVVQFGAILSVVFLYRQKFLDFRRPAFYLKLAVAIVPALAFGAVFKSHIESVLGKPLVIASILLLGGVVLLFVDKWFDGQGLEREEDITYRQAISIGLFQVLSILLPGLSRSAATIIGGMQQKLSRALAAEFSFFLAVPTMTAATAKSLYDVYKESPEVLDAGNVGTLLMGSVIAFVVAILAIRLFITFVQKNGFRVFGWYRIVVGGLLLALILSGRLPS